MGDSTGPRAGDGVWHHEYKNGVIHSIDWVEEDVYVFFYRRFWHTPASTEVFDISAFGYYHDNLNQWIVGDLP